MQLLWRSFSTFLVFCFYPWCFRSQAPSLPSGYQHLGDVDVGSVGAGDSAGGLPQRHRLHHFRPVVHRVCAYRGARLRALFLQTQAHQRLWGQAPFFVMFLIIIIIIVAGGVGVVGTIIIIIIIIISSSSSSTPCMSVIARVSGRVVVVVVRELFSLVTSAICVRIRGQRLRRLFTTWLKFFVYCCVLTTVNS